MLIACEFLWNSVSFLLFRDPRWRQIPEWPNRQVTASATSAELPRISERVGHGTLAGVGLRTISFEPAASAMGTVLASGLDAARGCAGIGARGVHRGSATRDRWPRPGSTTRRSRVAVAWRAAATGPTDEGRLRLDRSGSNTGVNANAPKRGDGVSASAYSAGASKDGEDIFVDASRSRRNSQPEAPLSSPVQVQKPTVSRRRLFLAAVAGGIVAETAGQLAESTLMSERERLQLDQKRQKMVPRSSPRIHRRGRPKGDRRTRPGHAPGRNQARWGHRDPRRRRIRRKQAHNGVEAEEGGARRG